MPLDVWGCTRVTLACSTSINHLPSPEGCRQSHKACRDGDRALQLSHVNEEFLVGVGHQPAPITSLPFVRRNKVSVGEPSEGSLTRIQSTSLVGSASLSVWRKGGEHLGALRGKRSCWAFHPLDESAIRLLPFVWCCLLSGVAYCLVLPTVWCCLLSGVAFRLVLPLV